MWYREYFKLSCSVRACREKSYHERRNKSDRCFEDGTSVGRICEVKKKQGEIRVKVNVCYNVYDITE